MASPGTLRVGRYFIALIVLFGVLYALVFLPGQRHTPKLGIDLVGGVRVIFTARGSDVTATEMDQARQIMEDRVNGTGVTQSTVVVQGGNQIVISIPNGTQTDVAALGEPAKLNFRGVVAPAVPVTCGPYAPGAAKTKSTGSGAGSGPTSTPSSGAGSTTPSASPSASPSSTAVGEAPNAAGHHRLTTKPSKSATPRTHRSRAASGSGTATPTGSATPLGSGAATGSSASAPTASTPAAPQIGAPCLKSFKNAEYLSKTATLPDPAGVYASGGLDATTAQTLASTLTRFDCKNAQTEPDVNAKYYVVCGNGIGADPNQEYAFLLGPVIVPGTQIAKASPQAPNVAQGQGDWTVLLNLNDKGTTTWSTYTSKHNIAGSSSSGTSVTSCGSGTPCADFVAFTLNGAVVSAPVNEQAIPAFQATQISGNFTASSAKELAQQLQYGALPLSFNLDQNEHVSATLGSAQLKAAFLAGGIGLILVVLYSLLYYRGLGIVTIASLLVSATFTYGMLVLLGIHLGFTLDLSGIAGFIVALGITADSFVVFFERIKDEVHDGRSFRVAVPRAWIRARRTILSADTVSFLAAAILYYFASADVKGFAFTLGLSTILDLVVVFLFTHPMLSVLSRSRSFGSARFTGLNSVRLAGVPVLDDEPAARRPRTVQRPQRAASPSIATRADEAAGATVTDETTDAPPAGDAADVPSDTDDDPMSRRRTTPEPGTAAERAAARRARMRGTGRPGGSDEEGSR